jgi:hypothetical protein
VSLFALGVLARNLGPVLLDRSLEQMMMHLDGLLGAIKSTHG